MNGRIAVQNRAGRNLRTRARRLGRLGGLLCALLAGLIALGVSGSPAKAQGKTYRLQFASYIGQKAAQMQAAEWWAKEVEKRSKGRITVKFFFAGSLLGATDILKGVADGRADLGYVANAYHPAELPLSSVVGIPFVTSNAEAQMKTFYELYRRNTAFRNEWEKQGVHVLFFHPLSVNILGTKEAVPDVAWLKGKRIRGLGYINQSLEIIGANPVAIAAPEIYEALLRGTIDGYSGFAFEVVTALKLNEVAPYITAMGSGNYVFAVTPITKSTWDGMPADLQKVLTDVSEQYTDQVVSLLAKVEDQVCVAIKKGGGHISVLPEREVQKIKSLIGDKIEQAWIRDASARGVDAAAFYKDYSQTLAKFEGQSKYAPGVRRCAAGS